MNRRTRVVVSALMVGALVAAPALYAQQRRRGGGHGGPPSAVGGGVTTAPGQDGRRVITIPVVEANAMAQRQRVWFFTPPAGSSAYRIGTLGQGHRVWALLPSCRQPNPDDPRDPCPVGRAAIEVITGQGQVASTEPMTIGNGPDSRRVQSFVVPAGIEQIRLKILRRDDGVRWEAAVDAAQLGNLPAPVGQPRGPDTFQFNLQQYPSL